jgi:hypothetical protein
MPRDRHSANVLRSNVVLLVSCGPTKLPTQHRGGRVTLLGWAAFGIIRWSLDKPQLGIAPRCPRCWRGGPLLTDKAEFLQNSPNLGAQEITHAQRSDVLRQKFYWLWLLPLAPFVSTLPAALAAKPRHATLRLNLDPAVTPLAPYCLGTGRAPHRVFHASALVARKWHNREPLSSVTNSVTKCGRG